MKPLRSIKPSLKKQKGDFLLESLIGLVLISIVGLGEVYVSARALVAERDMRMQEIAVNQMRAALIRNKLGTANLCADGLSITLPGVANPIAVTVSNCGINTSATVGTDAQVLYQVPLPLELSVKHEVLGNDGEDDLSVLVGGAW